MEAGERLGFLPGTLQEKVDPYLRPLYDALYDMLESDRVEKLLERNAIEVAPIAFMRGRTLNDSFIILDEAQNSTPEQMKMVLTRQGFNSKMVVNGDITQIDLPNARRSGLIEATEVLRGVEGISFVQFDEKDVVRHTLVQRIVKAYERYNETTGAGRQLTLKLSEPETKPAEPSAKVSEPEAKLAEAVAKLTEPKPRLAGQDAKLTGQEAKLTEPVARVTQCDSKVTEPAAPSPAAAPLS